MVAMAEFKLTDATQVYGYQQVHLPIGPTPPPRPVWPSDDPMNRYVAIMADRLNLRGSIYDPSKPEELRSDASDIHEADGYLQVEGHVGGDGRRYLFDCAMLYPQEPPSSFYVPRYGDFGGCFDPSTVIATSRLQSIAYCQFLTSLVVHHHLSGMCTTVCDPSSWRAIRSHCQRRSWHRSSCHRLAFRSCATTTWVTRSSQAIAWVR